MNSRSGNVDARGEQIDRDDHAGVGRLRNSRMRCKRPIDPAGDLADERVAPAENVAARVDQLVGVGGVGQVVGGEDQGLGEAAGALLVLQRRSA